MNGFDFFFCLLQAFFCLHVGGYHGACLNLGGAYVCGDGHVTYSVYAAYLGCCSVDAHGMNAFWCVCLLTGNENGYGVKKSAFSEKNKVKFSQ